MEEPEQHQTSVDGTAPPPSEAPRITHGDLERAAAEHHDRLMGRDRPLGERRDRSRELSGGAGPGRPA